MQEPDSAFAPFNFEEAYFTKREKKSPDKFLRLLSMICTPGGCGNRSI